MNNLDKINAINNSRGYVYFQLHCGDIFLFNSIGKIEIPDFTQLGLFDQDQYSVVFEFIYDRDEFEKTSGGGTFTKSVKIKDIQSMKEFKNTRL